jgi:predicted aspartyl protease
VKRAYSQDFVPPASMVSVVVCAPAGHQGVSLEGKIDSGADICALPESVVASLDLPPVREVRAAGFSGVLEPTLIYRFTLELAGQRWEHLEALATRRHYALIGRNVLRRMVIKLDGPRSQVTLTLPPVRGAGQRPGRATRRR